MIIKTRYEYSTGKIAKEIIEVNFSLFRRFAAHGHTSAVWQERIHTGEFHNILDPRRLDALETSYQATVPSATPNLFVAATGGWVRATKTTTP